MTNAQAPGAVLCDIDGVIRFSDHREVDRLEAAAGLAAGTTAGLAFAEELGRRLRLGELSRPEWTAEVAAALEPGLPAGRAAALAAALTGSPGRIDGEVVELLRRAKRRVPVLLVSNATLWLEEDLAALGLADLAEGVVNSARVGAAKPDPAIFRVAAERAGVAERQCLFVDDSAANAAAADRLGMAAVHFREPADLARALAPLWD
ncbi:HAD-IA family hydrolase [Kitasatospora purpeofusca]|uniref:HAD-IA family hydrolase n=1 Tax=Kitasatospora purpeofusca TaxID=67352 RepID=A0ABZ1TUE2_9ACTN|nr:HAD-IA family hydrolase [Kitasatospora purpeofusca]